MLLSKPIASSKYFRRHSLINVTVFMLDEPSSVCVTVDRRSVLGPCQYDAFLHIHPDVAPNAPANSSAVHLRLFDEYRSISL